METPEQYTVKTAEEFLKLHRFDTTHVNVKLAANMMSAYASELIKENERLKGTLGVEGLKELLSAREENKLYRDALTEARDTLEWHLGKSQPQHDRDQSDFFNLTANAIAWSEKALSKFQPKKDESIK